MKYLLAMGTMPDIGILSSLSPALCHVGSPEDDLKVVVEADGMRGDVGVPGHRHEPLAVQRPHRVEVGSDLCLNVVELNANLLDVAERPAERGDFISI